MLYLFKSWKKAVADANSVISTFKPILPDVPQGSILGPTLFKALLYFFLLHFNISPFAATVEDLIEILRHTQHSHWMVYLKWNVCESW